MNISRIVTDSIIYIYGMFLVKQLLYYFIVAGSVDDIKCVINSVKEVKLFLYVVVGFIRNKGTVTVKAF